MYDCMRCTREASGMAEMFLSRYLLQGKEMMQRLIINCRDQ